jgi:hypothetical protein
MDTIENNANNQTLQQTNDDKPIIKEEPVVNQTPAPPVKADKPKQTYKCLVCGKS